MKFSSFFNSFLWFVAAFGLFCASLQTTHAQKADIPVWIKIDGRLFGEEFEGSSKMVLRVYNKETGGDFLYEDVNTVDIKDGWYSTYLGDDTTRGDLMQALAGGEAYLEVTVNGTTFTPRERMLTVPYAVLAHAVVREGITEDMVQAQAIVARHLGDSAITGDKLAIGSITTDKLAPGAVSMDKLADTPWVVGGNRRKNGEIMILGTLDPQAVDLVVNGRRALRAIPHPVSPGIVAGNESNRIGDSIGGGTISGGGSQQFPNLVQGEFGGIGGGEGNIASGAHSTVGGGWNNLANDQRTTVGGGRENQASQAASTIAGGYSNIANQAYASIGGGTRNQAKGFGATIGGGFANRITETMGTIAGGQENVAAGAASTIGGGWENVAAEYGASILGGQGNRAAGKYSSIIGGTNNVTEGISSSILSGGGNRAIGDYSIAAGRNAIAANHGATVFADRQNAPFSSTKEDSFVIRARGGVGIGTASPQSQLHVAGEARADVVRANAFIGDGSNLTNVRPVLDNNAVQSQHIAAGAITADKFAPGALPDTTIKGGSITADKLAPDAVISMIPVGSITAQQLAPGVIPDTTIRPGSITAAQLAPGTIPTIPELPKNLITSDSLAGGALAGTFDKLVIPPKSITAEHLAPGTLPDTSIKGGSITADKLAPDAVISMIPVGSITAQQLAPGVIPEIPALPDNLLTEKTTFGRKGGNILGVADQLLIRPGTIIAEQLAPGVIPDTTIQPKSITAEMLADGVIPEVPALPNNLISTDTDLGSKGGNILGKPDQMIIRPGSIIAEQLAPGVIPDTTIQPESITADMLAPGVIPTIPEIPALPDNLLTEKTAFGSKGGNILGNADQLLIRPGTIIAEQLAPGVIPDTTIQPKSITAEMLADGAIPPLPDNLLTTEFPAGGELDGVLSNLKIKPGTITADKLAPGVIPTIPDIPALPDNLISTDSDLGSKGGNILGKPDQMIIRPGSIIAEQLAPGVIPDTTIQPKSITAEMLADGAIPPLPGNLLTAEFPAGGDLNGVLSNLKIKPGAITADKLAPGVIPSIPDIPALPDNLISTDSDLGSKGGNILGKPDQMIIRPGSIIAEQLAPGVIPDTTIQPGSITADKLAPGVIPAIPALPADLLNASTSFGARGGDVVGTAGTLSIRPGAITADKLAPGVIPELPSTLGLPSGISVQARAESPVILQGHPANSAGGNVQGSSIGGGGNAEAPNKLASDYATIGGGVANDVSGEGGVIGGGIQNNVTGSRGTVSGGQGNFAEGLFSTVNGGSRNLASGNGAIVPGGATNRASGDYSLAAGRGATAEHDGSFVWSSSADTPFKSTGSEQVLFQTKGFGIDTPNPHAKLTVNGDVAPATPYGGNLGTPEHPWNAIHASSITIPSLNIEAAGASPNITLGADQNQIAADVEGGVIMGGGKADLPNRVAADYGTVGGGLGNAVSGFNTTVAGGQGNTAEGNMSTVGGGYQNSVNGEISTIAGGAQNQAEGLFVTIGGGADNASNGNYGTISGGSRNRVPGNSGTIAGGQDNTAGKFGSVIGGRGNEATGDFSTTLGGQNNLAEGRYSIAAGANAKVKHDGVVMFADPSGGPLASSAENQFVVRASGGTMFLSAPDNSAGTYLAPGGGSFANLSDRNAKRDLQQVDSEAVLSKLDDLPIYNYAYKTQDERIRHIGPTSQDFATAFQVGESEAHITTLDADGVALAAIKALSSQVKEKDARINTLEQQLLLMQTQMEQMNQRLDQLNR